MVSAKVHAVMHDLVGTRQYVHVRSHVTGSYWGYVWFKVDTKTYLRVMAHSHPHPDACEPDVGLLAIEAKHSVKIRAMRSWAWRRMIGVQVCAPPQDRRDGE